MATFNRFEDIDGWDHQHVRRVRWTEISSPPFGPNSFRDTFTEVHKDQVRKWVSNLNFPVKDMERPLKVIPVIPPLSRTIEMKNLKGELGFKGVPDTKVNHIVSTIEMLRCRVERYKDEDLSKNRPSESETVTHLVVPFLTALGWSCENMAVEWEKIDIALFGKIPTDNSTLTCVVEAKNLTRSIFCAKDQAVYYANVPERENCKQIILTDGQRYAVYKRHGKEFILDSYLNLTRMRDAYPLLRCKGTVDAIIGMMF